MDKYFLCFKIKLNSISLFLFIECKFNIKILNADNCYKFLGCHAHTLVIGTTVFLVMNKKGVSVSLK